MRTGILKPTAIFFVVLVAIFASCLEDSAPNSTQQLEKDLAAIDSYLATNGISAEQDPNGYIRYVIHDSPTAGSQATIDSCITVDYSGDLMATGVQFDKGTNASFILGGLINGWRIGIPLLYEGDSATFYIPSGLAYGYYGSGGVPSNANLIFNIRLKEVASTYNSSNRSCD